MSKVVICIPILYYYVVAKWFDTMGRYKDYFRKALLQVGGGPVLKPRCYVACAHCQSWEVKAPPPPDYLTCHFRFQKTDISNYLHLLLEGGIVLQTRVTTHGNTKMVKA